MKKLLVVILLLAVFAPSAFGQDKRSPSTTELIGTTWVVYEDDFFAGHCGKQIGKPSWKKDETITFLENGKLMEEGHSIDQESWWKLVGNKLTGQTIFIFDMELTLKGNQMLGFGEVGNRGLVVCVRLVRQ